MKKILSLIIIIILIILFIIFTYQQNKKLYTKLIGEYKSAGNDMGQVELILNKDHLFSLHEKWLNIDFDKIGNEEYIKEDESIRDFTGKWYAVLKKDGIHMQLIFDQKFDSNPDKETYIKNGWKFINEKEFDIKVNSTQNNYEFQYFNMLIEKVK